MFKEKNRQHKVYTGKSLYLFLESNAMILLIRYLRSYFYTLFVPEEGEQIFPPNLKNDW